MDAETPQNGNVPSAKPAKQQKRRHSYKQIFNGFHHQQKTKKKTEESHSKQCSKSVSCLMDRIVLNHQFDPHES